VLGVKEDPSRGKVGMLGAALFAVSALFLPFVQFRPNRVLTGEAFYLWQLGGAHGILLLLALLLPPIILFLLPSNLRLARAICVLAAFFMSLIALSLTSRFLTRESEIARVSIGTGFWLSAAGVFLMISAQRNLAWKRPAAKNLISLAALSIILLMLFLGAFDRLSVMREYFNRRETFLGQVGRHLMLASTSVGAATLFGVPMAFLLFERKQLKRAVFLLVNMGQTIPTLALLGLLMVPLAYISSKSELLKNAGVSGIGFWPAWIALFIYALFPVLHNALAGLQMVDPAVTEAAVSVGMTNKQVFYRVQIPLAIPLMIGGVRTALTQSMGNAVLAALIGGGGLGSLIFLGLAQSAPDLILLGTVPLVLLTFLTDALLGSLMRFLDKGETT
jgi:osmoprotectant transport system permease protein